MNKTDIVRPRRNGNIMNELAYFEIQSDNPEQTADFYKNLFGWKIFKQEGMPIEYYSIETSSIRGGILKRPAPVPKSRSGTNAFTCSFEVKNFDDFAVKIKRLGGKVALEKFAVPGKCWQGYFLDPEGNVFGIFEVDINAK